MFTRTLWFLLGLATGITLIAKLEQDRDKTQYQSTNPKHNQPEKSVVELDAGNLSKESNID
jgi:hypothetical protein